jgi:hypothetical protein
LADPHKLGEERPSRAQEARERADRLMTELLRARGDTLAGAGSTAGCRPCGCGRGGVGLRGRGKIPLPLRQADAGFVTVAAGVRLLPFAPVDWVDIVDAAPIPVGVNFGATRPRQMIEQGGQGAFRPVHNQELCPTERPFPFALAASNLVGSCDVDHDLVATISRARSMAPISIPTSERPGSSRVKFVGDFGTTPL